MRENPDERIENIVLAFDPGDSTGWARFANGTLTHCSVSRFDDNFWPMSSSVIATQVAIEVPRYYPGKNKVDPNDLLSLALKAGEIMGHYRGRCERICCFYPQEWKGSVAKEIHHQRVLDLLTLTELALLPTVKKSKKNPHGYDNNMLDAVGLGLWFTKRTIR